MSSDEAPRATDFIRSIVAADVESGKNDGRVVTRFPPEPNGSLHIGHAKSICLNFGVAAENEGGVCHLRFDDTNPITEEGEYVRAIQEDVRWLGFDWGDHLHYTSDYFDQLYAFAVRLIEKGRAYVCDLSSGDIAAMRGTLTGPGTNSPYRERSVEENRDLFKRMRAGEFENGERVLRAKIDMASPNLTMRDPILYRVHKATHHRTGDRWCIYPMYDFAHCLSDSIEGITHSLCTLEFADHRALYDWILDELAEHPLAHHRVAQVEPRALDLLRVGVDRELVQDPVVERPVVLELQGAQRVGDALDRVRQGMCKIVHRVDAPAVLGAVVSRMLDAVEHRVAQVEVRRRHVDFRTQHA